MSKIIDNITKIGDGCTGCKMCADVCPKSAISFKNDDEGFWYPIIDDEKCNNCGLCTRYCPCENCINDEKYDKYSVYEVASIDGEVRKSSTSGGLFYELAKEIISAAGCVIGCAFSDDYREAFHICVESETELQRIIGTKYFQSDTEGIYKLTKEKLDDDRKVLFVGTPCQNAALRLYLAKDYKNLIQMDFVCNSINSPLVYRKWLDELENKYNAKVLSVRFKDKKYEWKNLTTRVLLSNGIEHKEDKYDSLWEAGLVKYNLFQRKSCYQCPYRSEKHIWSDLTCGDFWGLDDMDYYDSCVGVSFAIINSAKGEELFAKIKKRLFVKRRTMDEVKKGNRRMLTNPEMHPLRTNFYNRLRTDSFSSAMALVNGRLERKKNKGTSLWDIVRMKNVSIFKYIYLNYLCKNVVRKDKGKVIPFTNSIFEFGKDSQLIVEGNKDIQIGSHKVGKSKAETLFSLKKGAVARLYHGADLYYGTTFAVKEYASFIAGYFEMNTGSVIIAQKEIEFGEYVMCGRNCIIMDSDHHQIQTLRGDYINPPQKVFIHDHVWLSGNVRVNAKSEIGCNSIVGPYCIISKRIPMCSFVSAGDGIIIKDFKGRWSGMTNNVVRDDGNSKGNFRQVLVGYGKEGKKYYSKQSEYIDYIIDNHAKAEGVITFKEFVKNNYTVDDNYAFVIGSSRYSTELTNMVKKTYPKAKIVMYSDILHNSIK